ncbi:serine/threonine-protein kinase [Segetibacter sp.]|uniref:serine/threonine-protein kinase n=1 Tax=Segetibacter sp. TaxID=2231182 RepID=UPI002636850A|nr:serine/threonine-protein kinase [Segetibacter sp.]MCW3081418.1 hypothetical protein [Segetibacter sp.]
MARVFTIAQGLENMGGLKTGGQGSVYKGRRIGEIITAIKILPTPVYTAAGDGSSYAAFQNEVTKLKKVNEIANSNIVKILSSGLTEEGSFPFIEMEYIEGPDLRKLLQSPHPSVFTINEAVKVAEQLSNAIAHCHRMAVTHGNIKSNKVKLNTASGNYILLDFGLAMTPGEGRRSNISCSAAIEFRAPEQNAGQVLFQTDVYSFGVVLFELLTGTVPFPLKGQGESAANEVRLAHMISPVPDFLKLRQEALPAWWKSEKKEREMNVPEWLIKMISRCLEKKPERRFANGGELHNHIVQQLAFKAINISAPVSSISVKPLSKQDFVVYHKQLKKQLSQYQQELTEKENELAELRNRLSESQSKNYSPKKIETVVNKDRVSSASFIAVLFLTIGFGAFAVYALTKKSFFTDLKIVPLSTKGLGTNYSRTSTNARVGPNRNRPGQILKLGDEKAGLSKGIESTENVNIYNSGKTETVEIDVGNEHNQPTNNATDEQGQDAAEGNETGGEVQTIEKEYLVVEKAYFYDEPAEDTRRDEFISPLDKAVVQALNERYGFIYVVITDPAGQVFKGWLRKKDVKLYTI